MDTLSMYAKNYLLMGATKEEIMRPSSLGTKCSALQTKKIQIHNLLLYNIQALGSSPKHHPGALWLFGWLLPAQSGFPGILPFTVIPTTGVRPSKHLHSPSHLAAGACSLLGRPFLVLHKRKQVSLKMMLYC